MKSTKVLLLLLVTMCQFSIGCKEKCEEFNYKGYSKADLKFVVQVAAFSEQIDPESAFLDAAFMTGDDVTAEEATVGGKNVYRYLVGDYLSIPEVQGKLDELKASYDDAFAVAYSLGDERVAAIDDSFLNLYMQECTGKKKKKRKKRKK